MQLCVLFQFTAWAQSSWGRQGMCGVFLHQPRGYAGFNGPSIPG